MSESLPLVTVVIAARPDQAEIKSVETAKRLDYPREKLEIIVARGKQPAVQRNAAIKAAHGELIYFLDDDSVPPPDNLRRGVAHFVDPKVQIVGGPNLSPPDAPPLEQAFAATMSAWLAFGPSRARYAPVGQLRGTSEKEIILCNQLARRSALLELGGFDEALYPNEENALMDELQKRGGKLLYDPQFIVHRRPRPTMKAFCKMLMTYGRGRAEQFRLHPTPGSAMNFVPPLFCLYLALLLLVWTIDLAGPNVELFLFVATLPLLLYGLAVIAQAIWLFGTPLVIRLCAVPLIAATHLLYGLGFWRGLFTMLKPKDKPSGVEVKLETISFT
jgi:cellulose synthase/poly-beta-1,6-N-acetylglucosamine synthase-like glycosyltransferase